MSELDLIKGYKKKNNVFKSKPIYQDPDSSIDLSSKSLRDVAVSHDVVESKILISGLNY